MRQIPKYVENLLLRRKKLAEQLLEVCSEVDNYCDKIGVDMNDTNASILSDVTIYYEPWNAIDNTKNAIINALNTNN